MANNRMMVGFFIASESLFFLMLILAYVNFHGSVTDGPTALNSLDPVKTGIFSLFLFASSFTIWLAGKSLRNRNHTMLKVWILATIILGATFIYGQGLEWKGLIDKNITISRNVFGTTFFTLTGFHGAHVTAGVIWLGTLLAIDYKRGLQPADAINVDIAALYWHFVDVVWIAIFTLVYLIQ